MVPSNNKVLHGVAVWQRCLLMQLHRLDVVLNRPPSSGLCMAGRTRHAVYCPGMWPQGRADSLRFRISVSNLEIHADSNKRNKC